MELLVQQVGSTRLERSKKALRELVLLSATQKVILVSNPTKFFMLLKEKLLHFDQQIVQLVLELLLQITPQFGPDLETVFSPLIPSLILRLQSPDLKDLVMKVLQVYIRTSRNLQSVLNGLIQFGFSSSDWKLKKESLESLLPILHLDISYTANILEMKKVLEKIIGLINDQSTVVAQLAVSVAKSLMMAAYDFQALFSKLSHGYKQLFREKVGKINGFPSRKSPFAFQKPKYRSQMAFNIRNLQKQRASPIPAQNGQHFGFIPDQLMEDLQDTSDWRKKVSACQRLEGLVFNLASFQCVEPYLSAFFRFLTGLLQSSNYKISLSTLNILSFILKSANLRSTNTAMVIKGCINKLGDTKIAIRQTSFKVFLGLISQLKTKTLFPPLLEALQSSNWHIRQETLSVFIAAMLRARQTDQFVQIAPHIARLLDDSKSKIRFVATQALAVCARKCGIQIVNSVLKPIVDEVAFNSLQQRFLHESLPVVQKDYIEFPKSVPSSAPISSPYLTVSSFTSTSTQKTTPSSQSQFVSHTPIDHKKHKQRFALSQTPLILSKPPESPKRQHKRSSIFRSNQTPVFNKPASEFSKIIIKKPPLKTEFLSQTRKQQKSPVKRSLKKLQTQSDIQIAENQVYLQKHQLLKISNPHQALQKCLAQGQTGDWSSQFQTINTLRRICRHHSRVFLSQVALHNIVVQILIWADSLRSSLSKNALILLGQMSVSLGRSLSPQLVDIVKICMKKAIDTNSFISQEATRTLELLSANSNQNKMIAALQASIYNTRNQLIKTKACLCFATIFKKTRNRIRDLQKVVELLSAYAQDGSIGVRSGAHQALISVQNQSGPQFDRCLRSLGEATYKQIKQMINRPTHKSAPYIQKASRRKVSVHPKIDQQRVQVLNQIETGLSSSDWKQRHQSLSSLVEFVQESHQSLKQANKVLKLVDLICKGLQDQNTKVSVYAIGSLIKIIPLVNKSFEPHLRILLDAILPSLGATNVSVREIARDAFSQLIQQCQSYNVIPAIVAVYFKGNFRSKKVFLQFLGELVFSAWQKRPQVVLKHVFNLAYRVVEEKKEEVDVFVEKLFRCVGNQLLEEAPSGKLERILDILNKSVR